MPDPSFEYQQISSKNLGRWKEVIIPAVYSELDGERKELEGNYICLGIKAGREYAGALISHIEQDTGDLQILSIVIRPEYRRRGGATGLIRKLCDIAYASYVWRPGEYSAEVFVKLMYALPDEFKNELEAFLKKAGFTEFYVFEKNTKDEPALCGASMEINLFNLN
ncbi:MAG: GNAT family N-acetyltransferase [Lachnospiraceae bacterium]|nr:GNAT family N-acetyltransferase [Lachnospiraceae bacterium]